MKKILFLILAFLILICNQSYAANRYGCTALTGGGTGALDALDITASGAPNSDDLADGDSAIVTVISGTTVTVYEYIFDADGTDAESPPNVIRPDDYSSGGVWRLVKIHEDMIPDLSSTYQPADSDLDSLASGISGLVKGAGNGNGYSAATAGTDYVGPSSKTKFTLILDDDSGDSPGIIFRNENDLEFQILMHSSNAPLFAALDASDETLTMRNDDASAVLNLDVEGDINIGSGRQYKIGGSQISSSDLSDGSSLLKSSDIGTSVQAWDEYLDDIAGITASQGDILYFNGTHWTNLAPGTSGQFLQTQGAGADPQWATPSGSGDVTGPSSSTDNAIARFDGTGGKTIQNSNVTIDDTGNLNLPSGAVYQINGTQISTQNLSDGSSLGDATNIGIASGDNYTNFGDSADDSINELFAAIDASWPSSSGAPTDAEYVTLATNATLSAERVLTEGTALDITDGGAGGNVTIAFDPTEITDITWGVDTDTSQVWTWDTGTGTDPSLTITDDAFTFNKKVVASGIETSGSSSGPQLVWFLEDSDNGSNYVGWGSPASNDNDLIFLLPTSDPSANQILGFAAPSSVTFSDGTARDATQASWLSFGSDFSISGGIISIASGAITDADVNASAAIDATKIAGGSVDNTEFSYLDGVTSAIQTQLDTKAPLASPTLTGDPTAPTASANDNDTSIATTAYVQGELSAYASDSKTFTNTTFDANGTGNNLTNVDEDNMLDGSDIVTDSINVILDGGGSVLTDGEKLYVRVPYNCTIKSVTLLADQSGSVTVDIWKCTYSDFDAGSTHPVNGDSITASATPAISSSTKYEDTTLSGWTTLISAGDILAFVVEGNATSIQRVTIALKVEK